ncbi:B9 domain [Trinorchestia longiramus]|nr:B9 domain [Trinorchestia longiramus]
MRELGSSELLSASPRAAQAAKQTPSCQRKQFSETLTLAWQQAVQRPARQDEGTAANTRLNSGKKKIKRRIFTYTHKDNIEVELLGEPATTSNLPDRVCHFPARSGSSGEEAEAGDVLEPLGVRQCFNYFVMADLQSESHTFSAVSIRSARDYNDIAASGNCTVLLCCVRYDTRGELAVTPDFNHPEVRPYRIKGPGNTHFEYTIENASTPRAPPCEPSSPRPPHPLSADDWSSDEEADEGALQLTVTGELTRLTQCTVSGDVYLCYTVHLPTGWWAGRDTECEGVSVVCRTQGSVWSTTHSFVYSTPVSFTFRTHGAGNGWPVLLVAAFAVDGEDEERDVGWTAVDLAPARSVSPVGYSPMWSPAPQTPSCALQRTFLPGCRLLPHATYLAPYTSRHQVCSLLPCPLHLPPPGVLIVPLPPTPPATRCAHCSLAPYTSRHQVGRASRLGLVTNTTGVLEYCLHTLLCSSLRLPHPGRSLAASSCIISRRGGIPATRATTGHQESPRRPQEIEKETPAGHSGREFMLSAGVLSVRVDVMIFEGAASPYNTLECVDSFAHAILSHRTRVSI